MKKIFILAVMAIISITASAEVAQGFRMGVRANIGISNVVHKGNSMNLGYGAGWVAEYNFNSKLFLQSGIGLQSISHKQDNIRGGALNAYYAQLPIHVGYRFNIGEVNKLFVQAGPTLGVGIFGSTIKWDNGTKDNYFDLANRFDLGVGCRVGMEFTKLIVSVGADYGVIKNTGEIEGNNLSVNLGVGYMF